MNRAARHPFPVIDAHVHLSHIESFSHTARSISHVNYSLDGLMAEFVRNGVVLGIGMGVTETFAGGFPDGSSTNPMTLDMLPPDWPGSSAQREADDLNPVLLECLGVNPMGLIDPSSRKAALSALEQRIKQDTTVGIKLYAGYYHYHVHDPVYEPVIELAHHYGLPVVIHTGDTYSQKGLLKYSHPLEVDELAVRHRNTTFIICHLGDPWVMDGIEVVYKNENVYADLSGLLVGDRSRLDYYTSEPLLMDHFRRALVYGDVYEKLLFGTDWPLAPIDVYMDFIDQLIPERWAEAVYCRNALKAFPSLTRWMN